MAENNTKKNMPKTIDEALHTLDLALASQRSQDFGATVSAGLNEIKSHLKASTQTSAQAAAVKFESIAKDLNKNFQTVASSLAASSAIAFDGVSQMTDAGMQKAQHVAKDVDRQIRANPWPYIGGAALGMFALGLFLGRNQTESQSEVAEPAVTGVTQVTHMTEIVPIVVEGSQV